MANVLGTKGQIVIEKTIRESLGIETGYVAVQRLVGDRVEISFYPPEHERSLRGSLSRAEQPMLTDEELSAARIDAWRAVVKNEWAAEAEQP